MKSFTHACDRLVTGGLVVLIVAAPFAIGAVHPISYGLIEAVAFALVLVWAAKLWIAGAPAEGVATIPKGLWVPMLGFVGVVLLQLVPLPPTVLGVVSPHSYDAYTRALPGWPEQVPFGDLVDAALDADAEQASAAEDPTTFVLPSLADANRYGLEAFAPPEWDRAGGSSVLEASERGALEERQSSRSSFAAWQPMSLSPLRGRVDALKILAYLALFAVVSAYPVDGGGRGRRRFERRLVRAFVATAVAVALVALAQRVTWNGKLLWVFVPWDWGVPQVGHPRTSGPFVSRNNFAGYLALLFPLVLSTTLVPTLAEAKRSRPAWHAVAVFGAVSMAVAIVWSVSRGGWISAAAGTAVFLAALVRGLPPERLPRLLRSPKKALGALAVGLVSVGLFVVVPSLGREGAGDIMDRLEETAHDSASLDARVSFWRASVPLIADFPVLGSGLGSWGPAVAAYEEGPRMARRARRAHNDYVQLLAETGVLGFGFLLVAAFWACRTLVRALKVRSERARPIVAATLGGVTAVALHEIVDFDLQIPAIAVSFVLLFGLGLRPLWKRRHSSFESSRRHALAASVAAAVGLVAVLLQPTRTEPPATAAIADAIVASERHPLRPEPRVALAGRVLRYAPEQARDLLEKTVSLDPQGPAARDLLATTLVRLGDRPAALAALEESVARSPYRLNHRYLATAAVRWLYADERAAIERGFARALPGAGDQAAVSLALFHRERREYGSSAPAWQQAADLAGMPRLRADYFRLAGEDFARSGRLDEARNALEQSLALRPGHVHTWVALLTEVVGPNGDADASRRVAQRAMDAGVDPYEVQLALAEGARRAEDFGLERAALDRAVELRPRGARGRHRRGMLRYRDEDWAAAAKDFRAAVDADPKLAAAWYYLGHAEERQYHFDEARVAFESAVEHHPASSAYRRNLARFEERLSQAS